MYHRCYLPPTKAATRVSPLQHIIWVLVFTYRLQQPPWVKSVPRQLSDYVLWGALTFYNKGHEPSQPISQRGYRADTITYKLQKAPWADKYMSNIVVWAETYGLYNRPQAVSDYVRTWCGGQLPSAKSAINAVNLHQNIIYTKSYSQSIKSANSEVSLHQGIIYTWVIYILQKVPQA